MITAGEPTNKFVNNRVHPAWESLTKENNEKKSIAPFEPSPCTMEKDAKGPSNKDVNWAWENVGCDTKGLDSQHARERLHLDPGSSSTKFHGGRTITTHAEMAQAENINNGRWTKILYIKTRGKLPKPVALQWWSVYMIQYIQSRITHQIRHR